MLSRAISMGIQGIEAQIIEIEVDIIKGLPNFTIVGLPDSTIRESKDRIRSAIENSGLLFPPKNFIINLAPAGFKKQGANFDLPIAMTILHSTAMFDNSPSAIPMVGELSLDGSVRPVKGVISMAISLYKMGFREIIVPWENRYEASAIENIKVYPVKTILETIDAIEKKIAPFKKKLDLHEEESFSSNFSEVKGQETAKRALEVAAAGHHNILLYGSPGSGKTMLAKRVPSILPPLSTEQAIETTMIHSVGGNLPPGKGLITTPSFRNPHHTASDAALVGGGTIPSVGEISLSHNGILFLDEFLQFKNNVIQSLRQPLEDAKIVVSRASGSYTFPADFMLIAASNPCQCGNLFDKDILCTCPASKVKGYFHKISGPILDRVDLEVLISRVPYKNLMSRSDNEDSQSIRERVINARKMQSDRFKDSSTRYNSRMKSIEIKEFCKISRESEKIIEMAMKKLNLTARSFFKVLKVSRTIADLDNSLEIKQKHLLEALSYKNLQRNYDF